MSLSLYCLSAFIFLCSVFVLPVHRLLQRGLKTLKDRMRLQTVEHRLGELNTDISHVRKELSSKPG